MADVAVENIAEPVVRAGASGIWSHATRPLARETAATVCCVLARSARFHCCLRPLPTCFASLCVQEAKKSVKVSDANGPVERRAVLREGSPRARTRNVARERAAPASHLI